MIQVRCRPGRYADPRRFRTVPSNPRATIASCAASVAGSDAVRRIRSHTGSVSRKQASRSSQARARTSSPATARMSKATNRSRSVAAGRSLNTARVTAAKSCAGLPSRSLTATSSPSNVVPRATSVKGARSEPRRAVRSLPWRDQPRVRPCRLISTRSRKPSAEVGQRRGGVLLRFLWPPPEPGVTVSDHRALQRLFRG